MAVILEQVKSYLRIDDTYDDAYLSVIVETSLIYIDSMVGEEYKADVKAIKLADLLQLKIIADMYENRGIEIPDNTKQDRITMSILDKLSNYTT
ncbi:head-tail connector protein [Clostridium peptidivorans]|uniref:head-tail connector protein n=1 Tax=Clostridium peptidivorans TaxID=100174 RepID=UPI000BE34150|nr:head-tail connector protein [Clostridium peptidivorans]